MPTRSLGYLAIGHDEWAEKAGVARASSRICARTVLATTRVTPRGTIWWIRGHTGYFGELANSSSQLEGLNGFTDTFSSVAVETPITYSDSPPPPKPPQRALRTCHELKTTSIAIHPRSVPISAEEATDRKTRSAPEINQHPTPSERKNWQRLFSPTQSLGHYPRPDIQNLRYARNAVPRSIILWKHTHHPSVVLSMGHGTVFEFSIPGTTT
ncbi:hypothetical protein PQX77_005995 [Marasmius sp. AFHP31]|nr:hypothetical protein PQX77_005995 [Marasmius sp. AFHP31]